MKHHETFALKLHGKVCQKKSSKITRKKIEKKHIKDHEILVKQAPQPGLAQPENPSVHRSCADLGARLLTQGRLGIPVHKVWGDSSSHNGPFVI